MLDPTMTNYIDILVKQMIDRPETVLDRLQSSRQPIPNIPEVQMSKFLYCNGQPLPLPRLTQKERDDVREDINKAIQRLTKWENSSKVESLPQEVPKLNLRDIKKKHSEIRRSHESPSHGQSPEVHTYTSPRQSPEVYTNTSPRQSPGASPEVYTTAREDIEEGSDIQTDAAQAPVVSPEILPRVSEEILLDNRPAFASKVPVCQYSSSPMVSKTYKPLSAVSNDGNIAKHTSFAAGKEKLAVNNPTTSTAAVPSETNLSSPSNSYVQDSNTNGVDGTKYEPVESKQETSSSQDGNGELELSNSQSLVLETRGSTDNSTEEEVINSIVTSAMLGTAAEKSPPSSQVLRHLEALEAVIELDLTMRSTASAALRSTQRVSPGSATRRRLELNSPPLSPAEHRRPFNLNLAGVGTRRLPEQPSVSESPTLSNPSSPRKSISFYVEVDSPRSESPRASLARRNTIASPRSSAGSPRVKTASPRIEKKHPGPFQRGRSSSAVLVSPAAARTTQPMIGPDPGRSEDSESFVGFKVSGTPRRIRRESYSTVSSEVLDARASKIAAQMRGYLTRALLNSYKVQQHVKTIRDTIEILSTYDESCEMTHQDRAFYERLKETLRQTKEKVHTIFFMTSVPDQMTLIANTRSARRELLNKEGKLVKPGSARKRKVKKTIRQKAWI